MCVCVYCISSICSIYLYTRRQGLAAFTWGAPGGHGYHRFKVLPPLVARGAPSVTNASWRSPSMSSGRIYGHGPLAKSMNSKPSPMDDGLRARSQNTFTNSMTTWIATHTRKTWPHLLYRKVETIVSKLRPHSRKVETVVFCKR